MARSSGPTTVVDRLVDHIAGHVGDGAIGAELRAWLVASPRFRAFAEAHRDKIRKKVRSASEVEAMRDVRAELRIAQLLLAERRVTLAFEAYGSTKGGPDFTVDFRGGRPFNLEVTRTRRRIDAAHPGPLVPKLRQLPPSIPNAIVIASEGSSVHECDVPSAVRAMRAWADRSEDAHFSDRGFGGRREFYERFRRLAAVFVWAERGDGGERATVWTNPSAKMAIPDPALRACLSALNAA